MGGTDIRQMINSVVHFAKSKAFHRCTAPCDGLILKMHYRWSFSVFLAGYFAVVYSWYYKDIITCVSHYNAEAQIRLDYMNVCLSYPYIEGEYYSRRYILFYRWIHWVFLLLAAIYYLPRKLSKNIENDRFRTLLEEVDKQSCQYNNAVEQKILSHIEMYMSNNLQTHNGLYFKYIGLNVLSLLIDIFTLGFLDYILHGYFINYGFNSFPFERDPRHFSDYMSVMFPPFVTCEIDQENQLTAMRKEILGCHLTLMELYEKLFLGIWTWLIVIMGITSLYIVFLLLLLVPAFRQFVLRPSKPVYGNVDVKSLINGLNRNCKIGDIYVLYRLKEHISHGKFYELMYKLSKEKFWEIAPESTNIDVQNPSTNIDVQNPNTSMNTRKKKSAKQRINDSQQALVQQELVQQPRHHVVNLI